MMKKILSIVLSFLSIVGICSCGKGDGVYNPSENKTYFVEDVVREDMIFDTETLFAETTSYETLSYGALRQNMSAIKFQSAPYPAKNLESTQTFAVLGVPTTKMPKGGYPAIVLLHGGAGQVYPAWVKYWTDKGYVAIAPDMFGNELNKNLSKKVNPNGGPDETHSGSINDDPATPQNSWVYHCVTNAIRCNNILRSLDYVNKNQIGITGISWGGYITCIVAGVDKRFEAFAPVYGAGYIYDAPKWSGAYGGVNRDAWISAYDPSSYLPYATKPMLFVSGIDDNCFTVEQRQTSADLVKGKTFYSQRYNFEHGYFWDKTYEIYAFMQHILRGEDTVIDLKSVSYANGKAYVELGNPEKVESMQLVYTTDEFLNSFNVTFETQEVAVQDGVIEVTLPQGTTAFTFECGNMDIDWDFKMSSQIVIIE
ncbi:MAG: dienelactone hydrolase family protein [Clostridia bacterium]|nr:dienelactone hydrolase family protein [Clostridia bacterium]